MTAEARWQWGMLPKAQQVILAERLKARLDWLSIYQDEFPKQASSILREWTHWVGKGLRAGDCSWRDLACDLDCPKGEAPDYESPWYQAWHRLDRLEKFLCQSIAPASKPPTERVNRKQDGINVVSGGVQGLSRP